MAHNKTSAVWLPHASSSFSSLFFFFETPFNLDYYNDSFLLSSLTIRYQLHQLKERLACLHGKSCFGLYIFFYRIYPIHLQLYGCVIGFILWVNFNILWKRIQCSCKRILSIGGLQCKTGMW